MRVKSVVRSAIMGVLSCLTLLPLAKASAQATWEVVEPAELSLGAADGAFPGDFSRVTAAVRLQDGRVVVTDAAQRLVVFNPLGRHAATVTRGGQGPGGFSSVRWLDVLPSDSLLVWDEYASRISLFDSNMTLPTSIDLVGGPTLSVVGRFADGTWLATEIVDMQSPGGYYTYTIDIFRLDPQGRFLNDIVRVTGGEGYDGGQGARYLGAPRLGSGTLLKHARLVVGPDRVYVATVNTMEISMYGVDGSQLGSFSQPGMPLETTAWDIDRLSWSVEMANILRANLPLSHTLPAISQMMLDDLGNLWVGLFDRDASRASEWVVFDGTGRMIANTSVPAGLTPTHFGLDFVVGVWKDQTEVEAVRVHRLVRR
jgi:hypothetical protein